MSGEKLYKAQARFTTKYVPKFLETNVSIKFLCFAKKEKLLDE